MASLKFNYRQYGYFESYDYYGEAINVTATLGSEFNNTNYIQLVFTQENNGTVAGEKISASNFEYGRAQIVYTNDSGISISGNTVTCDLVRFDFATLDRIYCYAQTPAHTGFWFVGSTSIATEIEVYDNITLYDYGWNYLLFTLNLNDSILNAGYR